MPVQSKYTIKEVSQITGLPSSTLRYYESIGIIPAIERDLRSKQRTYTSENVDMIDMISCLHATGLSIEDMRKYIDNTRLGRIGAQKEVELLQSQAVRLEAESQNIALRKEYVATKIRYWQSMDLDKKEDAKRFGEKARQLSKKLKISQE
jgi:DNA-binding transcriptional MerR regulator